VARGAARRARARVDDATARVQHAWGRDELIYLVAPAGHPNYGDELIVRTWLRYLAQVRPQATVVVDCHSPGQAALLLRGDHPRALFTDTLWQLTIYAAGELDLDSAVDGDGRAVDGPAPWEWVADAATRLGEAPRLAEGVDLLASASTIHLVGGGYLNGIWASQVSLPVAVAAVVRRTGARAVATGHGLVPFLAGARRDALLEAAAAFDVFDVRDEASLALLAGVPGVRRTGDDVWLGTALPGTGEGSGPRVALCLQADQVDDFRYGDGVGVPALAGFARDTLDAWGVAGEDVTVVEGIPGRDLEVATVLGDRLAGSRVVPFLDVWRYGLPVQHTWISTRFHPHLVAAAGGDSGVAVVPRPDYYGTKHASLIAAGSRWTVVGDSDGDAATPSLQRASIPVRPDAGGFPTVVRDGNVARKVELAREIYPPRRLF
ncbi:polysaccharide pyruvyl transferase family protein, partial [Tsukamurella soli]|uniref:polysaccharide pyruvyl transferase family protein n=1 Tax=Tsukamurella soli TaxID=644556 RepID=UPI003CD097A9